MAADQYEWFCEQIYRKLGVDLTKYKRAQMERRITAHMHKCGYVDFSKYMDAMSSSQQVIDEFLDRMTINVSEFFRNPSRWDVIRDRVLPELSKSQNRINIWSSACSTGEEPYTLAIIMNDFFPKVNARILATDLDASALAKAKQGQYHTRSLANVPQASMKHFSQMPNGMHEISSDIKRMVEYQQVNLLEDPFERDFDLIVCRNVIIYFEEAAKEALFHKFSAALRPGGILFVGSTEQIFSPNQYSLEGYDTFFYQKKL